MPECARHDRDHEHRWPQLTRPVRELEELEIMANGVIGQLLKY